MFYHENAREMALPFSIIHSDVSALFSTWVTAKEAGKKVHDNL